MTTKVLTLENGIPKKTQGDHYSKSEVDSLVEAKEDISIQGDIDTLNASQDYTDLKIDQIPAATTLVEGFMSASDKTKLDGVATGATANDTNASLRDRSTHTGTQLSSTVSNFAATVLSTVLTGLSVVTGTDVVSADSILVAIGKVQSILNTMRTSVTPQSIGTAILNTIGTSTAFAKADHQHKVVLNYLHHSSNVTTQTTSQTDVNLPDVTHTTPPAGEYLAIALVQHDNSNNTRTNTFSLIVGSTVVPSTLSGVGADAGSDSTYSICVPITVNGSEDVSISWRTSANTSRVYTRSLTLIRVG